MIHLCFSLNINEFCVAKQNVIISNPPIIRTTSVIRQTLYSIISVEISLHKRGGLLLITVLSKGKVNEVPV